MHICTPPQTHTPLAIAGLRAGVAVARREAAGVSASARSTELAAVAGRDRRAASSRVFQHRFGAGAAPAARRWSARASSGRPLVATCETLWYRDDEYFAVPWRGTWEIEGGGPTMGHGIHQFDLLLSVLGPWRQVTRRRGPAGRGRRDTEDVSMALVTLRRTARSRRW